ncbi:MAG: response regulator transcription factor [Lachnospiraceae bacterium]|nr:response regulator transcription factor [Lachnospiraceae bacterium]
MKIMVADDDASIRLALENLLVDCGYEYCCASNGVEVLSTLAIEEPDLLILDVMMPGVNGFDVCELLRQRGENLPIIMLSAKGDIVDKSMGFKSGADDYMVKPFDGAELLLHIEAVLRRGRRNAGASVAVPKEEPILAQPGSGKIRLGDLVIYPGRYEAFLHGEQVNLTTKEFEIIALMASNEGEVFTREQILEFLWGSDNDKDINTVTVFIRRIREKIEDDPSKPRYVKTISRVGYKMVRP